MGELSQHTLCLCGQYLARQLYSTLLLWGRPGGTVGSWHLFLLVSGSGCCLTVDGVPCSLCPQPHIPALFVASPWAGLIVVLACT